MRPTSGLRIGLVGCGRLAEHGYVPALRVARGVTLAAVADPDPTRRRHLADPTGVPALASAAALLEQVPVDALVLATPAPAHLADARLAVDAGVPVLVEKPPAVDAAGAAALAALVPAPWVGFNRRFDAGVVALRAAVPDEGRLALGLTLHYRRRSWAPHLVADDALLDLGPHLIDLARWLTGSEVLGVRRTTVEPERAELELELGRGVATIRCASNRPHREVIEVRDERGAVLARHRRGGVVPGLRQRLSDRGGEHPLVASLVGQLESLAAAVGGRGGAAPPALGTAADGHAAMAVVDGARASAAARRPVAIEVEV